MTTYNVKYTDTTKTPISVDPQTELTSELDVSLFGRVKTEYGEELNENLFHLLENFSCPEENGNPGNPDLILAYNDLLENPTEGQFWYNSTQSRMFFWDGTQWVGLGHQGDIAANWGRICHGEQIPNPVSSTTGYVFPYTECIWSVSPANYAGKFDYMSCATDNQANVTMQYKLESNDQVIDGIANYLIIGIRGNNNNGVQVSPPPVPSPTPTPTTSSGVTPTPTVSPTPNASPGASPTPTATVTPTPDPTPSNTPAPGVTVTPTPTITVTPTPTISVTPTITPTPTISVTPSESPPVPITIETTDYFAASPTFGQTITGVSANCDISKYDSLSDEGITNCGTNSFGSCALNECAPEPGDDGAGAEMRITVNGGVPPYTVRLKNFTGQGSLPAGECFNIGFGASTTIDNSTSSATTITSFVIASDGGFQNGGALVGSCDSNIMFVSGDFDIEVEDSMGTIETFTRSWGLNRYNSGGGA